MEEHLRISTSRRHAAAIFREMSRKARTMILLQFTSGSSELDIRHSNPTAQVCVTRGRFGVTPLRELFRSTYAEKQGLFSVFPRKLAVHARVSLLVENAPAVLPLRSCSRATSLSPGSASGKILLVLPSGKLRAGARTRHTLGR